MEDFTNSTVKWVEVSICVLVLLINGIVCFNIYSNWVSEEKVANVYIEVQEFLDSCSKTGTIDKESFNKLCETAKENKMKIKMGVNSRDLNIDTNNLPENLNFSKEDTIIILATGVGRTFVEQFRHDPLNGHPVKDYKFANIV